MILSLWQSTCYIWFSFINVVTDCWKTKKDCMSTIVANSCLNIVTEICTQSLTWSILILYFATELSNLSRTCSSVSKQPNHALRSTCKKTTTAEVCIINIVTVIKYHDLQRTLRYHLDSTILLTHLHSKWVHCHSSSQGQYDTEVLHHLCCHQCHQGLPCCYCKWWLLVMKD